MCHVQWKSLASQATLITSHCCKDDISPRNDCGCVQEEFEAVMLPRHGAAAGLVSRRRGADSGELPYERLAPAWRVPRGVDWRGTGADGVVKDQATCGSCWAFGATAALQGAYWAATGDTSSSRPFSSLLRVQGIRVQGLNFSV